MVIDGLESMAEDQAYRAMDLLVEAEAQEAVSFAVADLLNLEVGLLFSDTTSTSFERNTEEAGDGAFGRYGHFKDHRPDLPQILIGLAVTKEGIPVRVVLARQHRRPDDPAARQTRHPRLAAGPDHHRRGPRVGQRGQPGLLRRGGGHFIAGMRMRDGDPLVEQVLSRQGRDQHVKENLRVKEVHVDDTDVRFIICHTPNRPTAPRARTPSPGWRSAWRSLAPPDIAPAHARDPEVAPFTPSARTRCNALRRSAVAMCHGSRPGSAGQSCGSAIKLFIRHRMASRRRGSTSNALGD